MTWRIKHFSITNMIEITGDDIAHFEILASPEEDQSSATRIIITFDELVEFIKDNEPALGRYLARIRSSIKGYGPKHSQVLDILYDEQFDFEKYLLLILNSKDSEYFSRIRELQQHQPEKEELEKLEQKMQLLDSVAAGMRQYNITYTRFLDEVDEALHALTCKYYPDLFEKGPEHISAYKKKLSNATINFAREIDRLMHDKF